MDTALLVWPHQRWVEGKASPGLLAIPHPSAILAARTWGWRTFSSVSTSTPGAFSVNLLPSWCSPLGAGLCTCWTYQGFCQPLVQLLKCAWMAARAFGDAAALSFVLSSNLLRVLPNPSSQPLVKMLKGLDALWTPGVLWSLLASN